MTLAERLASMGLLLECEAACTNLGVSLDEAFPEDGNGQRSRSMPLVLARWTVWAALESKGWSANAIGHATGFHHTTVSDGLRKIGQRQKEARKPARQGGEERQRPGKRESTTVADLKQAKSRVVVR